ncbi:hypothetical protein SAMN05216223_104512 [Actinacidiphila yanglinensis]|uniref:PknH-like extracellular domain-containing protein n=1 Tax=Actinacidiphila yanglinensis TaxID=310779 RepID=A0A1H5ZIB3_9ACTN|nr:hypothetical protein [Actinacidiphila yanglinensis]SEG35860.1 hypothetical protein SAMN05216223_104512 [Actinacidiphila yanglinensis]
MRIRARRRLLTGSRRALPIAALVPALALTAACGGGGKSKDSGSAASQKLTRSVITAKDVDHLTVVPATAKSQLLGAKQATDPAACQPVADQWSLQPKLARSVYTGALVTDTSAKDKGAKTISLEVVASYPAGRAKQVLDQLSAAIAHCPSYKVTRSGRTSTFTVKSVAATGGTFGDQQVTYTVTDPALGASGVALVTVVRVGDSTAAFETVRADHKTASLRAAITSKQVDKLRAAAAKS